MWDFRNLKKVKKLEDEIITLKSELFDMQHKLFEAESFEKIAADKLTLWVRKHDELLVKHKELLKNNEQSSQTNENNKEEIK